MWCGQPASCGLDLPTNQTAGEPFPGPVPNENPVLFAQQALTPIANESIFA